MRIFGFYKMKTKTETIYALASPIGKSAIATFRISGPDAYKEILGISSNMPSKNKKITVNKIKDKKGTLIDKTITTFFYAPHSYTGEDMVEISVHGGAAIIEKMTNELSNLNGFRLAEPGEFTRRSFENNKLDLTQVEAIADIINSETETQRKLALNQLEGSITKEVAGISKNIMKLMADIEAVIDFSDEDLPKSIEKKIKEQNKNIIVKINKILKGSVFAEKIRKGFLIAVVGKTNSGKSSFINKIANRDISIVTSEPGTTRDLIEIFIDIKGIPVRFFDTAGLRKSQNKAEQIGIKKAQNLTKIADINLIFLSNLKEISAYKKTKNKIFVFSKLDKRKKLNKDKKIYDISSYSGAGITKLFNKIFFELKRGRLGENTSVSRERHKKSLEGAQKSLKRALKNKNYDLIAEDVRSSLGEISKISGKVDVENILEIIFNDFCIGK